MSKYVLASHKTGQNGITNHHNATFHKLESAEADVAGDLMQKDFKNKRKSKGFINFFN